MSAVRRKPHSGHFINDRLILNPFVTYHFVAGWKVGLTKRWRHLWAINKIAIIK